MCSIHKATHALASRRLLVSLSPCLFVVLSIGCSTREKVTYDPVNRKPIVGDDAMALRADWPKEVAHYQNGSVVAWSTRYPYQTTPTRPERENLVLEPTMFIAQTLLLPVELIANPPGEHQIWHGVEYPPSYTAQPPLPPPGGQPPARATPIGPAAQPNPRSVMGY